MKVSGGDLCTLALWLLHNNDLVFVGLDVEPENILKFLR